MKFNQRYRQYPKGYELKEGEVSKDQLALFIKKGVVDQDTKKSSDYTIAELREMKPDVEDWESFIEGDDRKSVKQI